MCTFKVDAGWGCAPHLRETLERAHAGLAVAGVALDEAVAAGVSVQRLGVLRRRREAAEHAYTEALAQYTATTT